MISVLVLQQLTSLSMQCERAGHEEQIQEQNVQLDIIRHRIHAQKVEFKQEIMKRSETDKKEKEKREAKVNEMKAKIDDIEKAISESKKLEEDLRKILRKAQSSKEAKSRTVQESLDSSGSSELLGKIFTKNQVLTLQNVEQIITRINRYRSFIHFNEFT